MKRLIIFITVVFGGCSIGYAQSVTDAVGKDNLYNTQVKVFQSEIIADDFYLYISLPDDYDKSDKKYPVLYLLDGDVAFGMAASIARYLQFGNTVPELIIVGIGYGALKKNEGNMRSRDYSISSKGGRSGTGGAPKFREFLKEELFPYMESAYRATANDRTISGYSLGGLFAIYTLFTEPELFNNYIIGSPYLSWDEYRIFVVQENAFEKMDDITANVFISVGSEEDEEKYFNPIDEMVTLIDEKGYENLKMETKVFDGGTHLICPPEALAYGLVSVFEKEK
ncbi:MAG: alpha/beta hydrolase-fold protein [Ignavibacteriaceae bacterium]|jgi:predicted alpha/beta superfamily hydrolase